MKPKTLLRRMAVLVATLMCALGANAQQAYACYTPSNATLTFYYDNNRSSRTGTTYDLNTDDYPPGWVGDYNVKQAEQAVFDPSFANARPTSTYGWFLDMRRIQSITGIEYLNTSEVTDMGWMFGFCYGLTSLDVSHFNTAKVTSMNSMFCSCNLLTSLNLSSFNTSKVTDMEQMFSSDSSLKTIYVGSGWSTAKVTDISSVRMFKGCTNLVGGQGTTWNDSNPKDKTYAHIDGGPSNPGYFTEWKEAYACYTESNTTLMFYYDGKRNSRSGTTYSLNTDSNAPGWLTDDTKSKVNWVAFDPSFADARPTSTYQWFYWMRNLQSITGMEYLNTSEVTNMDNMFFYCILLKSIDLSHFNTSKVTSMTSMFWACTNLQAIYVGNGWSTAKVTESKMMFQNCTNLVGGQGTAYNASNPKDKTYAHIDGGTSNPGYFTDAATREAYACYTPSNTTLTFYYDSQRSSRSGTKYNLNTGDNNTGWYADGYYKNVTKVAFDPAFADARPTTTYLWFHYMTKLQYITGIEYLNTSEVTNMDLMFENCQKLTNIDVSHFNTSKVTSMIRMFATCVNLTSLDLSNFNTSQVAYMDWMFCNCNKLVTIYVGDEWSTAKVTNSKEMFYDCFSLEGGQGTKWKTTNPTDKTYAHIDGGASNPGYFTGVATGLVTHIEAVPVKANTVKGIYTLDGRKLNELPNKKGVYIVDGKKVVVK